MNIGLLSQLCFGATLYLERCVGQIRLRNDVVKVENASTLVTRDSHGYSFRHATAH